MEALSKFWGFVVPNTSSRALGYGKIHHNIYSTSFFEKQKNKNKNSHHRTRKIKVIDEGSKFTVPLSTDR